MTGCMTSVIIKVPPRCPQPDIEVGQEWEAEHCVIEDGLVGPCSPMTVYEMAPAVGRYMARLKQYCKGIDGFRRGE